MRRPRRVGRANASATVACLLLPGVCRILRLVGAVLPSSVGEECFKMDADASSSYDQTEGVNAHVLFPA